MKMRKILFITLSNIGDAILTLPVLSALRDSFPEARIDVVVGPKPMQIFTKDPRVTHVFLYDKHAGLKEKAGFIGRLRKEEYDLAVDMRESLIPVLIGAKDRTGLFSAAGEKAGHKRPAHLSKIKRMGINYRNQVNIYIDDKDREWIARLLEREGVRRGDMLIGVNPACRSSLKQWGTDGFIEVIDGLLNHDSYKVILIGEASQINIAAQIKERVGHKGLIDFTGKTGLNELFALTERLGLLLTCDSACMHIACDLGVKVVAIFGPTDVEEYGPTGKGDIVIRKDLKCSPCKQAWCRFDHECMKQVTVEDVLEAVKKALAR